MHKTVLLLALTAVGAIRADSPVDGIHSMMRAEPAPLSKFLTHRELLVRQPDTFPFHYFYRDMKAPKYERLYVAPVDVSVLRASKGWAEFDRQLSGRLGSDMNDVCAYMRRAYQAAFREKASATHLAVVGRKDLPKTLVLETAIVSIQLTKAELNAAGVVGSLAVPWIGLVTSAVSAGSITVECRIREAKTGKVIAMYADTENDPTALISLTELTWTYSARSNIKKLAVFTAEVMAAKDPRTVKRDFPFKLTSLISDSLIDED